MPHVDYGTTLRALRKQAGKTLGELADFLGLSISYVSDVELGNRAPLEKERNLRIAQFLGQPSDALLAAAAEWNGAFELDAKSVSDKAREVGAMLMRDWLDFTDEELEQFAKIVRKKDRKK